MRSSAAECKLRAQGSQVQVPAHAQEVYGVKKMKTILMQHTFGSSVGLLIVMYKASLCKVDRETAYALYGTLSYILRAFLSIAAKKVTIKSTLG